MNATPAQPQPQQPWPQYQAPPKRSSGVTPWIFGAGVLAALAVGGYIFLGGDAGSSPVSPGSPGSSGGGGAPATSGSTTASDSGMGFEFNTTYGLQVPGAAYSETTAGGKTRFVLSSGANTKSTIVIKPDGTYVWDSSWDDKVITGKWEKTGDGGYPIVIRKAQEGKDWRIGADTTQGAKPGTILVWDGSIWYKGFPLK